MKNQHRLWRILTRTFLVALFVAGGTELAAAAGGDLLWQLTDAQSGKQEAIAAAPDDQGNLIVTGFQDLTGGGDDEFWTVKFTREGTIAWQTPFAGQSGKSQAIVVDSNRDVIVTGYVWNGTNRDIQTVKYSRATGAMLWQHTFDGAAHGNDIGTSVAVDSLNNVYVGGNSQNAVGKDTYVLIKYASSGPDQFGNPLWRTYWNETANGPDQLASLAVGSSGVVATGASWNGAVFEYATVKFDSSGTKIWERRYGSPAARDAWGKYVRIDGAGNCVVTGFSSNTLDKDIYTAKYDGSTGAILWERLYSGVYDDEPNGLVLDLAGDAYVTGSTWTLSGNNNFYTARYSGSNGSVVWQSTFDSGNGSDDVTAATGIAVDDGGDVFVTGYSVNSGNYDLQTIKYRRSTGTQLWQQRFNGPANLNERPVGIGVALTGEVLVGGWTDNGGTGIDLMVIKYDPGLLNPPTGLAATTLSKTSIQLTWTDNAANEDGFAVERKLGENGTYAQIATVGVNVTTYTDSNLAENNVYYYRVRSYNAAAGNSHYSNETHALTVYINLLPPAWSFVYNSPDNQDDFANAIAVGSDGHPVVTGYSLRTTGGFDYFTARLNRLDGGTLWSHLYDDPDSELDVAKCVAVDSANNAIVSGYASLFYSPAQHNINSIFTLKYPPAGPPAAWTVQYNGPGAIDDRATAIATTTDAANNVVVTGYGKNGAGNEDIYLVKYAPDGTKAWAITPFDGAGHGDDFPSAVAFAPDGSVYVTGYSERGPLNGAYNLFTAKYHGTTGALIWSDVYSPQAGGNNRGAAIVVDAAGDPYVTGTATNSTGNQDIYLVKYSGSSQSPQRLWERWIDGAAHGDDVGIGVVVDSLDGTVAVAGTTLTAPGDHDFTLARYTSTGNKLWQQTLQRHDIDDLATALAGDMSGYLYVAGNTNVGIIPDQLAVLFDYDGNYLGATTYAGGSGGPDETSGIAVNTRGEAFVAGYTTNASGNADYLVFRQTNPYLLVPAPFAATSPIDFSKLVLSWGDNSPGASFRVERTLGPVTSESVWTQIATPVAGSTGYQDNGLNGDTAYCYRITAVSGSLVSRKLTACGRTTLPPPAMSPLAILSATAIDISWANVLGNTGYKLERQAGVGNWVQVGGTLATNTTVYHDTGLTAGTVYGYRISTLSSFGTSLPGTILVAPVLNALAGITAAKIDLTWPAVPGATGYKIERSPDGSTWSQVAAPAAAATGYSDTTVASGTFYYYRLKAVTSAGDSVPSLSQTATTLLPAPVLNALSGVMQSQITLSWADVPGNAGYKIERSPNGSTWTQINLPAASVVTYTDSPLAPNQIYYYRVSAKNSAGAYSVASNVQSATTVAVPPPVLNALTGITTSEITLSWADVPGNAGYKIERSPNGSSWTQIATPLSGETSYPNSGLAAGTLYYYRVFTKNSFGYFSVASNVQSATTTLVAPGNLTATVATLSSVTLAWSDVVGETNYQVEQDGAILGGVNLVANSTSYTVTGLSQNIQYCFRVKPYNAGSSAFSNQACVTIYGPPTISSISGIAQTQLTLNWSDVPVATGYEVWQSAATTQSSPPTSPLTGSWNAYVNLTPTLLAAGSSAYPVTSGLTAGYTYKYKIRYKLADSSFSLYSNELMATTIPPLPASPAISTVTTTQITMTWSDGVGETGYSVQVKPRAGADCTTEDWTGITPAAVAQNGTSYPATGLTAGTVYCLRASAANSAGSSSWTTALTATTLLPAPVLNALSGVTQSQITLSWADVPGNAGYKIERSPNGSTWTQIATPLTGETSYVNTGLAVGTLYYYRIFVKNSLGYYSGASNVQWASTNLVTPAAFALTVISDSEMDLSWRLSSGASEYHIEQKVGGGDWSALTTLPIAYSELYCGTDPAPSINCPSLSARSALYQSTGLTQGTTYCYRVAAWNSSGGYSVTTAELCGTSSTIDGPVLTTVMPLDSRRIRLDWTYTPAACTPVPCLNPDGFEVEVQTVSGQWVRVMRTANVTTYVDTLNIEPLQAYRYRVRAYKGGDVSSYSNELATVTPAYAVQHGTCP